MIGYVTNWTGVIMLFQPVHFRGIRIPGLARLVQRMPRKIQQIPGFMQGGMGWQGIIPSRAAKMGSIAVDKGIAKIGSPRDFYRQIEPDRIAEHILDRARPELRETVERIMQREHPGLWNDLTPRMRERVHERVEEQLPDIVHGITDEIGEHIDQLLDIKLMVVRHLEENPEICNRVYHEVGERELKLIIRFGFLFGFLLGFPVALITMAFPYWWVLPLLGIVVGYVTNLVAIWMIFEPVEPRKVLGIKVHGLFIRRQREAGAIYARVISEDVVTMGNMGRELLEGPSGDRTRLMIHAAMRPAVDRAVGPARPAVRVAVGAEEYDAVRESFAAEAVEYTASPLTDRELDEKQKTRIRDLFSDRIVDLPPADFSEMLRSAMREDEWLLYLHGAVLGFVGGLAHLAVIG